MEYETRWDDFLIAEHELIERAMAVLKDNLEQIDAESEDLHQIKRALDFLLEFGDKIHNKKEEQQLFPLMGQRGIPVDGGPLGVMLMEHQAERELIQKMLMQVGGLKDAHKDDRQEFRDKGIDYLKIRAEHIWKENDILYPMARNVLQADDAENLLREFIKIDQETYGPEARGNFVKMVEEAEKGRSEKTRLINGLSYEQIHAIMEAMPFEVTFVDAEDTVAYFNRLDKEKLFPRTRSVIGRKVEKCHPEKSVGTVQKIVTGFKERTLDKAEFWIDFRNDKVLIRYFPVYSDDGQYMGVLEVTQAIGEIQKIQGQKRLLD
ncbi:MAG: PAS domain-containing protein [Proteobacteria bacterium]|nr:PAS domain-containing protein [Pseudomonadota bacterium]MBU1711335.1 PAS domain-containing protein [Pseudomonadota bacterium]